MSLSSTFQSMPVPAYKISKAALNMLTVQYAHAYAGEGFTFMSLSPGVCSPAPCLLFLQHVV